MLRSCVFLGPLAGLAAALALPLAASAIVIRHDTPDAQYRVPDGFFPPLADLPVEGQGVLIAPRWVVTAGHAVAWQGGPIPEVTIASRRRAVVKVIFHPDFKLPKVPDRGPVAPWVTAFLGLRDIALIQLAEPVSDVKPALLYRGPEKGQVAELIGKGATGDGVKGVADDAPHRTVLRRAFNRIDSADGPWLIDHFEQAAKALPLEGVIGNGDSGGPLLIQDHGVWKLAGVASWKQWDGDLSDPKAGLYGVINHSSRLAYYRPWIEQVLAAAGDRLPDGD
jgi:hypothetical protein